VGDVDSESIRSRINQDVPASPRVWNYWIGGKDNYEADRVVGDLVMQSTPQIVELARSGRAFLIRAISHLTAEEGVRQFLDIGTGLPTADNTHQIAQRIAPEAKVVYVDNDPIVLAHARALLVSSPEGEAVFLDADMFEPEDILTRAKQTLDFTQPIALIFSGILGHVPDWEKAKGAVTPLLDALPSGSYLVLSDGTNVLDPGPMNEAARIYSESADPGYALRTPEQLAEPFAGLELLEPGIVPCADWRRPEGDDNPAVDIHAGVGRKP
jgi:hypothetical protein